VQGSGFGAFRVAGCGYAGVEGGGILLSAALPVAKAKAGIKEGRTYDGRPNQLESVDIPRFSRNPRRRIMLIIIPKLEKI